MLPHGDALVFNQLALGMLGADGCFLPVMRLDPCVKSFPCHEIGSDDGSDSHEHGFIRADRFRCTVRIAKHKLAPQRKAGTEVVVPPPPAVAHGRLPKVFALMQQRGHIINLLLNAEIIRGQSRCKPIRRHRSTVDFGFIDAVCRQRQPRRKQPFSHGKGLSEHGYKPRFPAVIRMCDPKRHLKINSLPLLKSLLPRFPVRRG